jgi:hypothetical protein
MYVLLVFSWVYGGYSVSSHEFSSKDACETARYWTLDVSGRSASYTKATCLPK